MSKPETGTNQWQPIESAPESVRDGAAIVMGIAGQLRCRAYTPDGREFFALWTGPSHGDPVTHYQSLGGVP